MIVKEQNQGAVDYHKTVLKEPISDEQRFFHLRKLTEVSWNNNPYGDIPIISS